MQPVKTPSINDALDLAQRLGWYVFPANGKRPQPRFKWGGKDDPGQSCNGTGEGVLRARFAPYPGANIGVNCGSSGIVVIDLDLHGETNGLATWEELKATHKIDDAGALVSITGSGGKHLIFKDTTGGDVHNSTSKLGPGIDVRGNGGYIIAPPSIHPDTGQAYQWEGELHDPAPLPPELVKFILDPKTEKPPQPAPARAISPKSDDKRRAAYVKAAFDSELATLAGTTEGQRNNQLYLAAKALGRFVGSGDLAQSDVETALEQKALAIGLGATETQKTIASGLDKGKPEAWEMPPPREEDQEQTAPASPAMPAQAVQVDGDLGQVLTPPALDDTKNGWLPIMNLLEGLDLGETGDAALLAKIYRDRIAYDHAAGNWQLWTGHYWQEDITAQIPNLIAYQIAAQYLNGAALAQKDGDKETAGRLVQRGRALCNRRRVSNVQFLAQSQPALALDGQSWDANPWLLGVTNGTVDLRTGELLLGQPGDYIRKVTPTAYDPTAPAPRWAQFLNEIFDGDLELIAFMQRLLGYGITGLAYERVLPILWGYGANGKDTLLEAISTTLGGELASAITTDVLLDTGTHRAGGPSPHIVNLRGKRLVWASETNEGARLNTGQVKQVTGGGELAGREVYGRKEITFKPSHLLMLLTNEKPKAPADDLALWDRLLLIPFNLRFVDSPSEKNERLRDKALGKKLAEEKAGILTWLVRGCLEWQRTGLQPPESVKAATQAYQEEVDTIGAFLEECTIEAPNARAKAGELYQAYKTWTEENSLGTLGSVNFGKRMQRRFERKRETNGYVYQGLGLLEK